jgi:hypothetical protein
VKLWRSDDVRKHPEAVDLRTKIHRIFEAKSKNTVHKRYREVMAIKEQYTFGAGVPWNWLATISPR